jgi:hypothetical protein
MPELVGALEKQANEPGGEGDVIVCGDVVRLFFEADT